MEALRLPPCPSLVFGRRNQQPLQFPHPFSWSKPPKFNIPLSLPFSPPNHSLLKETSIHFTAFSSSTSANSSTPQNLTSESQEHVPDRTRLIAQNIPWTCTAQDIRNLFERYGTVTDVELSMYNKIKNRGLAFVTMGSEDEALEALANLDSFELDDRIIKVEFSRTVKKKPSIATNPVKMYDVFVGNLSWKVTTSDLKELFGAENENILRAEVVYHTKPRRPAGYGFVSFASKEEVKAAIDNYNGKEFMGRSIHLEISKKDIGKFRGNSKGIRNGASVTVNEDAVPANQANKMSPEAK